MFEILYEDPVTIAKYRLAPLLEEREWYLRVVVHLFWRCRRRPRWKANGGLLEQLKAKYYVR